MAKSQGPAYRVDTEYGHGVLVVDTKDEQTSELYAYGVHGLFCVVNRQGYEVAFCKTQSGAKRVARALNMLREHELQSELWSKRIDESGI